LNFKKKKKDKGKVFLEAERRGNEWDLTVLNFERQGKPTLNLKTFKFSEHALE